jgi:hypothetical protein
MDVGIHRKAWILEKNMEHSMTFDGLEWLSSLVDCSGWSINRHTSCWIIVRTANPVEDMGEKGELI